MLGLAILEGSFSDAQESLENFTIGVNLHRLIFYHGNPRFGQFCKPLIRYSA
jgi:hypothetical protein